MTAATSQPVSPADRLSFTLFLALAVHALLIFGIGFASHLQSKTSSNSLEVTLAFHPSDKTPEDADFIAQSNQRGSGSLDETREQTTDQKSAYQDDQLNKVNLTPPSVRHRQQASRLVITSISTSTRAAPVRDTQDKVHKRPLPESNKESLTPLTQTISTLQARLAQQKQAYAERPRYHFVNSVSAVASYEALYINNFRQEVEAVGTRNFPKKALRDHIFGNVRLRVNILPNGHISEVKLLHSSGHPLLDHSAIRSVQMAAPFAPFTQKMREGYAKKGFDQLAIIRTWKFTASSRLTSSYNG